MSAVLQLGPIGPLTDSQLAKRFCAIRLWEQPDPAAWLAANGAQVRVVATSVRIGCDKALIDTLPSLGAICSWGVGHETLATEAASARGVQVSTTPDVLDDCVADMAWALLLAAARRIGAGDRYVRDNRWHRPGEFPLSVKVSGKRMGILGLGRIGRAIARRGEGFDMAIRYHGRTARPDVAYRFEPSLVALADWCDFLVIACIGGASTRHLVSADVLTALGPRGVVVNIARGTVIDQAALIAALQVGRLGGAGLDVLDGEPGAPPELRNRDDVVLMPHVGSATVETRAAMEQLVVDNVTDFLETGHVRTPIQR